MGRVVVSRRRRSTRRRRRGRAEVTRWRLDVAYDGSGFRGFAVNVGIRSVAGELQGALAKMCGHAVVLVCAGRTDAEVHARRQVVHFESDANLDSLRMVRSLNRMLGPEIAVIEALVVPGSFDARFSAIWRRYRYSVVTSVWVDPQLARFVWHTEGDLDAEAMREAAQTFVGRHDFSAFCRRTPPAPGRPERSRVRNLFEFAIVPDGTNRLDFWVLASSFCHHQVRSMVGTLVEVGEGRRSVASVAEALESQDRQQCGRVAPAHGLTLWEVGY